MHYLAKVTRNTAFNRNGITASMQRKSKRLEELATLMNIKEY